MRPRSGAMTRSVVELLDKSLRAGAFDFSNESREVTARWRSCGSSPTRPARAMHRSPDMTYPVQAADLAIYCVNWGFRLPTRGMDAPVRPEIADDYGRWLAQLQFHGEGYRDGAIYESYGILFVPDPYEARQVGE